MSLDGGGTVLGGDFVGLEFLRCLEVDVAHHPQLQGQGDTHTQPAGRRGMTASGSGHASSTRLPIYQAEDD